MSDFRFESPAALNWLWLLPILAFLVWYFEKSSREKIKKALGEKLMPFLISSVSTKKRRYKTILELIVLVFAIVALARPQTGDGRQKVKNEGIEIVLLVDVSRSMGAEDIKPSRLDFIKTELKRLVDQSGGDRFGLVAFAWSATLLSPMTPDQSAIKMYIDSLTLQSVSSQGTFIGRALEEAREAFKRGGIEDEDAAVTKVVLIASDAEDHEPGAVETARKLAEEGIHVFALGVGTETGGPIPIKDGSNQLRGYHRDSSGEVVVTKLNPAILREIAQEGKGSFHHASFQGDAIAALRRDLERLQKSQFADGEITIYEELFQPLLVIALLLALLEILMGERNPPGRIWKGRFEVSER